MQITFGVGSFGISPEYVMVYYYVYMPNSVVMYSLTFYFNYRGRC